MQEGWTWFVQYALQTSKLSAVFQALLSSVATVHPMTCPSLSATFVIDVESVAPKLFNLGVIVTEELPASSQVSYTTIAVPVRKRKHPTTKAW